MSSQKYGFKCEICGCAKILKESRLRCVRLLEFAELPCVKSLDSARLLCVELLNLAESNATAESPFVKWQSLVSLKSPNCLQSPKFAESTLTESLVESNRLESQAESNLAKLSAESNAVFPLNALLLPPPYFAWQNGGIIA